MTSFIKLLQNPIIKIFFAPFAFIGVGTIVGLYTSDTPRWLNGGLLLIIVIASQLIDHFFTQKYLQTHTKNTPTIILYICEAILLAASISFILVNNWVINVLLLLYIIFLHIQYQPFPFVNTFYQFILNLFFHGLVLNCIAFYSQTTTITNDLLLLLIPMILVMTGITIEINELRFTPLTRQKISPLYHWTGIGLILAGLGYGLYLSLPSSSYFIAQIIFAILVLFSIIPAIVPVDNEKQRQNKINYLSTVGLIFSIMYSLAIIF